MGTYWLLPCPQWRCWSAALLPCGCGPWWYRGMSGQPCCDCPWDTQDVQRTNRPGGWHSHVLPCEPQSLMGRWSEVVYFWEENAPEPLPTDSSYFLFAVRLFLSKDGLAKHLVHGGPFIHPTLDHSLCAHLILKTNNIQGYAEIPSDLDFRDGNWKPAYRGQGSWPRGTLLGEQLLSQPLHFHSYATSLFSVLGTIWPSR